MKNRSLSSLLSTVNYATNPAVCRSDHEHARNRQLARAARNALNRAGFREGLDYHESDFSGRLISSR